MNKLINITNENGNKAVSARELYLGLGLHKAVWVRWYQLNIIESNYFLENVDWVGVQHNVEGNDTMDFAISIDFAKHIAMMARTEKSHEYRNYFLECEKEVTAVKQMTMTEIIAASAQQLVEMERKVLTLDSKLTSTLEVFTAPTADDWKHDMSSKINQIVESQGFSHQKFRGDLYEELECLAHCDITARQSNLRKRMKEHGATYKDCAAATKLDVVDRDVQLKPIFEGIVRKYQAKFV